MFVQANPSPEQSRHGLGVGLTLVKRIVELHGGTLEVRSDGLGHGSEFVLRVPVAKDRPRQSRARQSETALVGDAPPSEKPSVVENGTRRILVVDDDLDLTESLAMALSSLGNSVRTAHDGAEAVEIAKAFRPHAVALDVSLSTMNGFDVVRELRQESWGRDIIIIALTGWSQDDVRERALEAGFDHFMVKPVEAALLTKLFDTPRANATAT
jgi:CheY-like chemotaxis protein